MGDPGAAAETGEGIPRRWLVPASATNGSEPVTFELEVTHHWTQSARIEVAPELVAVGSTSPRAERNRWLNVQGGWFGLIALSQVGMTFLAVYFWDRRRSAYLYFAVQAFTASYYPAYIAGLAAMCFGWRVQNMLLAQSLAVAPIISVYFTHAFFGLRRPSWVWLALLVLAMLSPMLVLVRTVAYGNDFLVIRYSTAVIVVCVLSSVSYQIVQGVRLFGSYPDRRTVLFFLCSWTALGASSWVDLLAWMGGPEILGGGRPACIGLGLFGLFQSMLLSRSHSLSLVESDRLNDRLRGQVHDLEERQGEIETLNEELRRQIGRRTADILAALTDSDPAAELAIKPGDVIEGRYRIVDALGFGGMGAVYEVERVNDGRRLALKVTQEVRGQALARLAREAQIATQVHHPNVVSVVDADVARAGYAFLVMELVEGRSLAECDKDHDVRWRLGVLLQVLRGMGALHEQGIIHRDLKPSNILVSNDQSADPRVKITDFGISRWLEDEQVDGATTRHATKAEEVTVRTRSMAPGPITPGGYAPNGLTPGGHMPNGLTPGGFTPGGNTPRPTGPTPRPSALRDPRSSPQLTKTGQISGTPAYVAPELAGGTALLSPAVDVFSFGVVAYGLLTGKHPFIEPPFLVRLEGREVPCPTPVATLCSDVASDLARAIDSCLAPTAAARPAIGDLVALVEQDLARDVRKRRESAPEQFGATR